MDGKTVVKEGTKTGKGIARNIERFGKKAWSIMDAAANKNKPSDYLSPQAIQAMQGKGS